MKNLHKLLLTILSVSLMMQYSSGAIADTKLMDAEKPNSSSNFLPDYSLLKPVTGPEGTKAYRYTRFDFDPLAYSAVMLDPVAINQQTKDDKLTPDVITSTQQALNASIQDRIGASKMKIAHEPGAGVLRVSVSISGAEVETEGFKPRNILPISAVIKLASKAAGKDSKKAVLLVESKIVDSVTGQLMRAGMITIASDSFRDEGATAVEFKKLAEKIVDIAMKNSNL